MKYTDKVKLTTEVQEATTQHILSCDHLTTTNWMELNVAYVRNNTPRERTEIDTAVFARPMPMQVPVMAKGKHNLSTYFVPFRTLTPQWNAFITHEPYIPSNSNEVIQVTEMPYTTTGIIWQVIINNSTTSTATNYDFIDTNTGYRLLTSKGRYIVKILNQLGYQIVPYAGKEHINMMRLLALGKVYLDWYANSAYFADNQAYIAVQSLLKEDNATAYELSANDIEMIITLCRYACYEPDYFTAAFQNPNGSNSVNTSFGQVVINDINGTNNIISTQQGTGEAMITNNLDSIEITQFAIKSLQALQDMATRYQLAGNRAVDRYAARFGVVLTEAKMNRSLYYGTQTTPIEFGAIYSTAQTQQGNLGDYAGNGMVNSDNGEHNHFDINEDEFGIIIEIGTMIPIIGYVQGIDRENLATNAEQYFNGQFDALGNQAIFSGELYVSEDGNNVNGTDQVLKNVFGYIPRQAHLKIGHDRLTGDFRRTHSLNAAAGAWHLYRMFNDQSFGNNTAFKSMEFTEGRDAEQYLRIFDETNEDSGDKFNIIYQHSVIAQMHTKALYDTYDFESEGKQMILDTLSAKKQ